jgi:hypothetical protein
VSGGRAAKANTQVNFSPSIHIFHFINIISGYPIFAYHQNMSPYNPVGHYSHYTSYRSLHKLSRLHFLMQKSHEFRDVRGAKLLE